MVAKNSCSARVVYSTMLFRTIDEVLASQRMVYPTLYSYSLLSGLLKLYTVLRINAIRIRCVVVKINFPDVLVQKQPSNHTVLRRQHQMFKRKNQNANIPPILAIIVRYDLYIFLSPAYTCHSLITSLYRCLSSGKQRGEMAEVEVWRTTPDEPEFGTKLATSAMGLP